MNRVAIVQQPNYQRPVPPVIYPQPVYARPVRRAASNRWLIVFMIIMALGVGTFGAAGLGGAAYYVSGRILPGVSALGASLGGMSRDQAADMLAGQWTSIPVRVGDKTFTVNPAQIGLALDAAATAANAAEAGRGNGNLIKALFGKQTITPVLIVDAAKLADGITALAPTWEQPAQNATIRMVSGQLAPIPPVMGTKIDVAATVAKLTQSASAAFATDTLELVTTQVAPTVTDATVLLQKAQTLLASPLTLNLYDPVSDQSNPVSIPAAQWGAWLTTENTATGVQFAIDKVQLSSALKALPVPTGQTFDIEQGAQALNKALAAGSNTGAVQIRHQPTQYQVRAGDNLTAISWRVGIPGWRIARANPTVNLENLSVGQTITIPPKDVNLDLPIVPNKRIVISISKQKMWVYENGQMKWDWAASTGISSSPTMPGIFQIQSHEQTAYASNWDLDMPFFMGIYDAVPGFSNGIHGMPTRNGYSVLWENALGRPVTYGCILLSNTNVRALYQWAENGVVVEVQV
jgi:lipoprotein-anchoring transpeptidase ErfK/SrfK